MDKTNWRHLLHRDPQTNKYDYGHVLIVGGSEAMVGAPVLAARAALRTGAGAVTIASSGGTVALIDRDIEEIMTLALPPWSEVEELADMIKHFIDERHVSVVVIGPGLSSSANDAIRLLLSSIKLPVVLDAEAFTALSGHLSVLQLATNRNNQIILTPHLGEYDRLVKNEPQYGEVHSHSILRKFTHDYNITLALKGHNTLVTNAMGETYENKTGNPGLATAGAGDVLAGIIAGILAQEIEPYEATKMAVLLHGLAGDIAARSNTEPGMIASDIIEFLPEALRELAHRSDWRHDVRPT